jgi:cell division protein FtsI (penicillin-binding protein 3)
VVLHGTGTKALLEGYTSAGKTGTAQKVDPATHAYSHTKYVATFAGFAPINNPAITVAVILDSAVGLHQGGQVSAPVFQRITQQVLEYLHVAHDVDLPRNRQLLLASRHVKEQDLAEGSPDHLGEALDITEAQADAVSASLNSPRPMVDSSASLVQNAALRQREVVPAAPSEPEPSTAVPDSTPAASVHLPANGTVVLEVEQGGIVVPSFSGRSVRAAIELAEENGLDLDAEGSGLAEEQSPAAGTHVAGGSKVIVKFRR